MTRSEEASRTGTDIRIDSRRKLAPHPRISHSGQASLSHRLRPASFSIIHLSRSTSLTCPPRSQNRQQRVQFTLHSTTSSLGTRHGRLTSPHLTCSTTRPTALRGAVPVQASRPSSTPGNSTSPSRRPRAGPSPTAPQSVKARAGLWNLLSPCLNRLTMGSTDNNR